jgi:GT2 family glycosyltransferase
VSFFEVKKPPPPPPKEDLEKIKTAKRVRKITDRQNALEKTERAEKLKKILNTRNKGVSIGGRWQGKNIRTVTKFGANCADISKSDSIILLPISVKPNSIYRIVVTASKISTSGNGELLVNFSAGRGFDGPLTTFKVNGIALRDYSLKVQSPRMKIGVQTFLRIWRSKVSAASILIKDVRFSYVSEVKRPALKARRNRRSKSKGKRNKYISKEDKIMKFRPYGKLRSSIAEKISEVVITEADQVPKVSIITPTRDGCELLKACWKAMESNTAYPNWEWVIGDSNSSDGTAEFVRSIKSSRVKFVQRGTTDGSFSSINNELAEHATGEYLLFLNDDTRPQSFWLYEMMSKIHRHPEIGIVGAKLLYGPKRIQHAGIAFLNEGPGNLGKAVLKTFPEGFADQDRFYQAVTGACLLIRREDFETVNKFDERYWFCYEDIDLCLKVKFRLKKKILYAANAEVFHRESITQNKFKTAGEKQKAGIVLFKQTWMAKVRKDFYLLPKHAGKSKYKVDVSFVTCVSNLKQYTNFVVASLFNNQTAKNYEIVPVLNFGNKYSAAQALNLGISKARGKIIVCCHQDLILLKPWIDMLFERIAEIEDLDDNNWGILGTAGITAKDDTIGVVYNVKGRIQWQATRKRRVYPVQTVDEHCIIMKKKSGLRFDEAFDGFHMYSPSICLLALERGLLVWGQEKKSL